MVTGDDKQVYELEGHGWGRKCSCQVMTFQDAGVICVDVEVIHEDHRGRHIKKAK